MSADPTRSTRPAKRRIRHPLHLFPGRFTTPGTAPGDLTGPPSAERLPTTLHLLDYGASGYTEKSDCSLADAREYFSSPNATWLHVNGTPSAELLREVGEAYELHPLALEDVMHTGQRAKRRRAQKPEREQQTEIPVYSRDSKRLPNSFLSL